MEEILKNLVESSGKKETINKQCYFNLQSNFRSWNEPTQFQITKQFHKGTKYLQKSFDHNHGLQSVLSTNLNFHNTENSSDNHNHKREEILTSLIALDMLHYNSNQYSSPSTGIKSAKEFGLNSKKLSQIVEFITPSCGLTSFSLYKFKDLNVDDIKYNDDDTINSTYNVITLLAISVLFESGNLSAEPAKIVAKLLKDNILSRFESQLQQEEINDASLGHDIDPIECCNLLRLLFQLDLSDDTQDIQDYLYLYLEEKLYLQGSSLASSEESLDLQRPSLEEEDHVHLSFSPDAFLYFLTRAIILCPKAETTFKDLLWDRVLERLGSDCGLSFQCDVTDSQQQQWFSPINIALRILTLNKLTPLITMPTNQRQSVQRSILVGEMRALLKCQLEDGSFPSDSFCIINQKYFFGGSQISSLIALPALQSAIIPQSDS